MRDTPPIQGPGKVNARSAVCGESTVTVSMPGLCRHPEVRHIGPRNESAAVPPGRAGACACYRRMTTLSLMATRADVGSVAT
ncbi:hypothetical protein GCM10010112_24890 [Actinoplanes lobatus]|uniref:Uncharacterized protein n=1 Tax=Actinoplanes lobatus TaxID=113568 RepID=A0ABQ4AJF2_9ACTN|nr:hypothetical protein GCM10010112_24890 [Actinoplanes lobatus]GIE41140.1 hypothetical protein Alo02nite_40380 [Actinoplanes lobatus]